MNTQIEQIFNIGQIIVPKNHRESGLMITDIRDGRYYSRDLEICTITDQHEWEVEEDPASEDLEKEIRQWWNNHYGNIKEGYTFEKYTGHYLENTTIIELARHFANWQKQQMHKQAEEHLEKKTNGEILLEDTVAFDKGFKLGKEVGAKDMKQQMMEDVVEGMIAFDCCDGANTYGIVEHHPFCLDNLNLKAGQKVKLIIVKEDKQ